jgi:iron complex transport system ATP-binding protein
MKLDVKNLSFSFKSNIILNKINFSSDSGECIFLLGENGAGKTTLFRCILGLLREYTGDVLVDGINCKRLSVKEMARKISYIPQAHSPTFNYSVFQTALMGTNALMNMFSAPGEKERQIVFEKLEMLGISHLAERGYAELSGGERQLVLVARALVQNSRILIMDEPTANLDYGNQFRIMEQVKKLAHQGYLILLSTHNPEHALLFADKVLILKDSKIMMYGTPAETLNPQTIENIYGIDVEVQIVHTNKGNVPVFVPCVG